jgi:hypothetical protein
MNFALDARNRVRSPGASRRPSGGTSRRRGGASRTALRGTAIEKKRTANPSSYTHFASLGMDSRTRPVLPQNRLSGAAERRPRRSNRALAVPNTSSPSRGTESGGGLVFICVNEPRPTGGWCRGEAIADVLSRCLDGAEIRLEIPGTPRVRLSRWAACGPKPPTRHALPRGRVTTRYAMKQPTMIRLHRGLYMPCGRPVENWGLQAWPGGFLL